MDPSSISTDDVLQRAVSAAFINFHNKTPKVLQLSHTCHVLESTCRSGGAVPILTVASTGGGKSASRDCAGFCLRGIILTIVPLLSLAADQTEKMNGLIAKLGFPIDHLIKAYNLDTLRNRDSNIALLSKLRAVSPGDDKTIFLFSSPQ